MVKSLIGYRLIIATLLLIPSYLLANISPNTHDLITGDYNGDGFEDVFARSQNTVNIHSIVLSNGLNQFNTSAQTFSNGHLGLNWSNTYSNVFSGDFNSDGRDDILLQSTTSGQSSSIVLTNSEGELNLVQNTWPDNYLGISWNAETNNLITGLFDSNNATDIILQGKSENSTHKLVTNQGAGLDSLVKQWNTDYLGLEWSAKTHIIHSGDFNGDGRSDVFLQAKYSFILLPADDLIIPIATIPKTGFSILLSNPDGTFTESSKHQYWLNNHPEIDWLADKHKVTIGDFNGDGKSDIFLQSTSANGTNYLLQSDASSQFSTITQSFQNDHLGLSWSTSQAQLVVADSNNDGKDDLIYRNLSSDKTTIVHATASGIFNSSSKVVQEPDNSINLTRETRISGTEVFGSIGGSFEVTPSGTASYSIPIDVPPGIAGIQPSLALNYISQASNGLLGVGWSVSGLSVISRCPRNYAMDNQSKGIEFNNYDRLCLDGQRLILVSGAYGKAGATYRTEVDSFAIIIGSGDYNTSSSSFVVRTKSGQILNYGNTSDSKQLSKANGNIPIAWSVNKVSDVKGNYFSISYIRFSTTEASYPHRIDYTKNSNVGLDSQHSVRFVYEGRNDANTSYALGDTVHSTRRLAALKTYHTETLIKSYQLNYEKSTTTKRSRIKNIQVCNGSNECIPATKFSWSDRELYSSSQHQKTDLCKNAQSAFDGYCNDKDNHDLIFYPDINGDGYSDLCYRGDAGIRCYKGSSTGIDNSSPSINTDICANSSAKYGVCNDGDNYNTINFVDVDADGKDDLTYRSDAGIQVWLSNGTSFYKNISTTICANGSSLNGTCNDGDNHYSINFTDINADALLDVCYRSDSGIRCHAFNGTDYNSTPSISNDICSNGSTSYGICNDGDNHDSIKYVDVNADGKSDLVYRGDQGIQIWHSTGNAFVNRTQTDFCANGSVKYGVCNGSGGDKYNYIQFPDVNGDSLPDLCFRAEQGIQCHLNNGKTFSTTDYISTSICKNGSTLGCNNDNNYKHISFIDFNSDGKADLTYRSDTGIQYWLSTGDTFVEQHSTNICNYSDVTDTGIAGAIAHGLYELSECNIQYSDINGDGIIDLSYRDKDNGITIALSTGQQADLITSVTDELQNITTINYGLLTDSQIYTKGTNCVYPEMCIQAAMPIVASYTASNGVGGLAQYSYRYNNLSAHLLGRGALGFESFTHLDQQSDILTTTNFNQVGEGSLFSPVNIVTPAFYPSLGATQSATIEYIGGSTPVLLEKTINTPSHKLTSGYSYFSYVAESTQTKYDYPSGNPLSSVNIKSFYDGTNNILAGNVTKIEQTTTNISNGIGAGDNYKQTTVNTYEEDNLNENDWYLGRLTRATVTHSTNVPDANNQAVPNIIRVSRFGYEPNTGLLSWSIENSNDTNLYKKTSYLYDDFGNKETVTVEGHASALYPVSARTSTSQYESATFNSASPIIKTTNALLHESYKTIDARFGVPTATTGPNNLTTNWLLDGFGRVIQESRADGNNTITTRKFCDSSCQAVSGIIPAYYTTVDIDGLSAITTYYDQLGRQLRIKSFGLNGESVYQDTVYNAKGQVTQQSNKYYSGPNQSIYWSKMTYDDLGRVETETAANGRLSTTTTNGFTTTNTIKQVSSLSTAEQGILGIEPSRDLTSTKTHRVNGKLQSITDANGGNVNYYYNAVGNLIETHAPGKTNSSAPVVTKISYDNAGRKTSMDDPDMGQWQYFYDAYGNLRKQTNAKNETTAMVYDDLNRMTLRIELEGINRWVYDNAIDGSNRGASIGKLITMAGPIELSEALIAQYIATPPTADQVAIDGSELYKREFSYNNLGLAVNVKTTIDDGFNLDNTAKILNLEVDKTYDQYNRVKYLVYPQNTTGDRLTVEHVYNNANGALLKIQNALPNALNVKQVFWELGNNGDTSNAINAMGQIQNETFGNGLTSIRLHNEDDGTIKSITTGGLSTVQNLSYVFDNLGNLERRSDENQSFIGRPLHERFKYDTLGRLTNVTLNDISYQRFEYDASGNITYNSGFGYYQYDRSASGRAHAVTNITSDAAGLSSVINGNYQYDANGNQYAGADRAISYTSYNKPNQIVRDTGAGIKMFSFSYGADHQRYKQNTPSKNIYYLRPGSNIGAHFEREEKIVGGEIKDTHYLYAGKNLVATYIAKSTNEKYAHYHHRDHLGSVDIITDAGAFDVAKMSYAPFGERRNFDWTLPSANTFINVIETNYGFTGHEHIDDVGLIHMNGRVYDPKTGRFVSADPNIQAPENSQSYNRYSYVLNNPLSYTDPSGYFFKSIAKVFRKTVKSVKRRVKKYGGVLITLTLGPVAGSIVNALISGASFHDFLKGAVVGFVTQNLTNGIPGINYLPSVVKSGISAGLSAKVQGGSFSNGFKNGLKVAAVIGVVRWGINQANSPSATRRASSSNSKNSSLNVDVEAEMDKLRKYSEIQAIEKLHGRITLDSGLSPDGKSGYVSETHTIYYGSAPIDTLYKTVITNDIDNYFLSLPGGGDIEYNSYPKSFPISLTRFLAHESFHSIDGVSDREYLVSPARSEYTTIRNTNNFMWKYFKEPARDPTRH